MRVSISSDFARARLEEAPLTYRIQDGRGHRLTLHEMGRRHHAYFGRHLNGVIEAFSGLAAVYVRLVRSQGVSEVKLGIRRGGQRGRQMNQRILF